MTDQLKQVFSYIKKGLDKADRSLKRPLPPIPVTDRVRDIFDADNPIKAVMKTPSKAETILLNLNFGQRLENLECCSDCLCARIETFTAEQLVAGQVFTTQPYVSGSVAIYVDDVRLTSGQFSETNPAEGHLTLFVSGDAIKVSYVYTTGNCTCLDLYDEVCPELVGFTSGALVFSDKFDRESGPTPTGGCGRYVNSDLNTPVSITTNTVTGYTSDSLIFFVGGPNQIVGSTWEILMAFDATALILVPFSISVRAVGTSSSWESRCNITSSSIAITGRYYRKSITNTTSTTTLTSFAYTRTFSNDAPTAPSFIRFTQLPGSGLFVKIWAQDQPEPTEWSAHLSQAEIPPPAVGFDHMALYPTMGNVQILGAIPKSAINVWGAGDTGDFEVSGTESWRLLSCFDTKSEFGPRFGGCSPANLAASPIVFDESGGNQMSLARPTYVARISYPHFNGTGDGLGRVEFIEQEIREQRTTSTTLAHPINGVVLRGELRFTWHDPGITAIPVAFMLFDGNPPNASAFGFNGSAVETIFVRQDSWTEFEVFFPMLDDRITWGIAYAGSIDTFARTGAFFAAPFLFGNTTNLSIQFRNERVLGVATILCEAEGFCTCINIG